MKNVKKDFPIFKNNPWLVYLDSCATTQKPSNVINSIKDHLESYYSNIHRWLYHLSEKSEDAYIRSKKLIADFLWVKKSEIIYTYNSTYAFNILAESLYYSWYLQKWDKILLWIAEHHSNIVPWLMLKERFWIEVEFIWTNDDYDLDIDEFDKKYDEKTKLVALNYVSNVTWTIFDIKKISKRLNEETLFVVDGSQAVPNFSINLHDIWCDFFVFTWHKVMANTWIWVLWWKKQLLKKLNPSIWWWWSIKHVWKEDYESLDTVEWFEAWTPNLSWAVSLLAAFEYIRDIWWFDYIWDKEQSLVKYAIEWFEKRKDKVQLIWKQTQENRVGVFSFIIKNSNFSPIKFWEFMAMNNICLRCGWHCAHPYLDEMWAWWTCRISVYLYNDFEDLDKFFDVLDQFLDKFF